MADDLSSQTHQSTVNLVRSSHPWTKAGSAAGFVLRYLVPMRRQLTSILGTTEHADEALKLLLSHLVSVGFGDQKRGRLRDFLLRGVRSAGKSRVAESPENERPEINLEPVTLESREWLSYWRYGILERAWRALERREHAESNPPLFTILLASTSNPKASAAELAKEIGASGSPIDVAVVESQLPIARALFAQLVADEVAETLESPTGEDVKQEIGLLGLGKAFNGVSVIAKLE